MKYRFNKQQLTKELEEAIKTNNIAAIENYQVMLDLIDDRLNVETVNIKASNKKDTYKDKYNRFGGNLGFISEDIFDYISSLFTIEPNIDKLFDLLQFSKIDLSNKELLDLGYEVLSTIDDQRTLNIYREITKPENHYLNVCEENETFEGENLVLGGITFYDKKKHKSYISVHRSYDITDLETVVHEALHASINKSFDPSPNVFYYFDELEGRLGNQLVVNYLKEHHMDKYADELICHELYLNLQMSFLLYLNDLLLAISNKHHFKTREATRIMNEETPYKDAIIQREDLDYIFTIDGYETTTDLVDYMIVLELLDKYSPADAYLMVNELRKHDSYDFYNTQMENTFDFFNDEAKVLRRTKEEIDKKIRVIE